MTDIPTRIRRLANEHFCFAEPIPDTSRFDENGADDLDLIEWLTLLEEEFDIGIDDDDARGIVDIRSSIVIVERMVAV